MKSRIILLVTSLFLTAPAWAYFSTVTTADVVPQGKFELGFAPQFVLTKRSGVNLVGRADYGLSESTSVRGLIGFGNIDFQTGGFFKWSPIPDLKGGQPGMAIMGGVLYARDHDEGELSFRVHPIISKNMDTDFGSMTPYASIPFGLTTVDSKSVFPVQAVIGSEIELTDWTTGRIISEIGFNLNKAFSYITIGVTFPLDNVVETSAPAAE
jgi:hypothetical protein